MLVNSIMTLRKLTVSERCLFLHASLPVLTFVTGYKLQLFWQGDSISEVFDEQRETSLL